MRYIGRLHKRRSFVYELFRDFRWHIKNYYRRTVHIDPFKKKIVEGYNENFANIIIPGVYEDNYYMTIRIRIKELKIESDNKEFLYPILYALREWPLGCKHFRANLRILVKRTDVLYTPVFIITGELRIKPLLYAALKKAIKVAERFM